MPGIEDTEQIQYEKLCELQRKNDDLALLLKEKIKLVGEISIRLLSSFTSRCSYLYIIF